jgi:hypothetical protein
MRENSAEMTNLGHEQVERARDRTIEEVTETRSERIKETGYEERGS